MVVTSRHTTCSFADAHCPGLHAMSPPPPCSNHGNIVPHLGHGCEFQVHADIGEVLKKGVTSILDSMHHKACQQ